MGMLLDQIVQLTTETEEPVLPEQEVVHMEEVVETAVHTVSTQIREKTTTAGFEHLRGFAPPSLSTKGHYTRFWFNYWIMPAAPQKPTVILALTLKPKPSPPPVPMAMPETLKFIQITVQDSGQGVNPKDRANVFNPHYQAENPLIPGLGDTSAGLSLARSLTVANGGRIWVDGEPGMGSTFSILFPLIAGAESKSNGINKGPAAMKEESKAGNWPTKLLLTLGVIVTVMIALLSAQLDTLYTRLPIQPSAIANLIVGNTSTPFASHPTAHNHRYVTSTNNGRQTAPGKPSATAVAMLPICGDVPSKWVSYIVQPGDTYMSLSAHSGATVTKIVQANCLDPHVLPNGIQIYLPATPPTRIPCGPPSYWARYLVQPGDTMFSIWLAAGERRSTLSCRPTV